MYRRQWLYCAQPVTDSQFHLPIRSTFLSRSQSDNLFLSAWASLRAGRLSLRSRLLLLALLPVASIWASALLLQLNWQYDSARQANEIGHELSRQIANSLLEPLQAEDQLSLNLQLSQWRQNPLIAHARLYGPDNRVIAEAGRPQPASELAPGEGSFIASIQHQDSLLGRLHLSLAGDPFRAPMSRLFNTLSLISLFILLLATLLAWQQGNSMRRLLQQLGRWSAEQGQAPAGVARKDEIGELARQLEQRRIIDQPLPLLEEAVETPLEDAPTSSTPPSEDSAVIRAIDLTAGIALEEDEEDVALPDASAPYPAATSTETEEAVQAEQPPANLLVLVISLGNLDALQRLPRPRLLNLLERYRSHVQQAAKLYAGKLHSLEDGSSLILFHNAQQPREALTHALCCGELLRILGHDLQVEIADTGLALHMCLALGQCHSDAPSHELAQDPACQRVFQQVRHSRNLLLLDAQMAENTLLTPLAVTRRLASQPDIHCVERLKEPYQSLLERQLNQLHQQHH